MKGTLEKLRRIFISKRRQEDDLSTSKFSRSLSFKKASMRRSLRRLTRRKAVVTNHGIIYVEGDQSSVSPSSGPGRTPAAATSTAQRTVTPAVNSGPPEGPRTTDSAPTDSQGQRAVNSEVTGPQRSGSDAESESGGDAAGSSLSPPAGGAVPLGDDANFVAKASSGPPASATPREPEPAGAHSRRATAAASNPAAAGLASSTGNISAGSVLPRVRRPTDSLPRPPTEVAPASDSSRRASHCGVSRAVEAPRTPQLAGRTARIMSASLTQTTSDTDDTADRQDAEDDTKSGEDNTTVERHEDNSVNSTSVDQDKDDASPQEEGTRPSGGGGGARRRLPTVLATRDHLRRSLRRLSERRRKSRRPESVADTPAAGLDFYRMFTRVPPVLGPAASVPSAPFTFSRRNPITQWLAESESAMAARRAPGAADWDALLWSELVLCPPASEKEARRRAKRAAKRAGRARRSGWRTSSEASVASAGTAASEAEVAATKTAGKGDSISAAQSLQT